MDLLGLQQLVDRVGAGEVFVVNVGQVLVHLALHLGKHLIFALLELGRIVGRDQDCDLGCKDRV